MYKLYIERKSSSMPDHYMIKNESGDVIYNIDQDFETFGNSIRVDKANDEEVFTIERKNINSAEIYEVSFDTGRNLTINNTISFHDCGISLSSDDYDLQLDGKLKEMSFVLSNHAGEEVGKIEKKLLETGTTNIIEIHDKDYEDVLVSLFVVFDEIKDN